MTRAQRAAVRTFTAPLAAGALHYPGQPFGDEADPESWSAWIAGPVPDAIDASGQTAATIQGVFGTEFFKYFIYGDSAWRYVGYDLSRALSAGSDQPCASSSLPPRARNADKSGFVADTMDAAFAPSRAARDRS